LAYQLQAFLGPREVLEPLRTAFRGARLVPLLAEPLVLSPFVQVLRSAVQARGADEERGWPFSFLSRRGARAVQDVCTAGSFVYVDAEFFGGAGHQSAVGFQDGAPAFGPVAARDAINQALRFLGVQPAGKQDEFDTVGLFRHRSTDAWYAPSS
jgi:hypothetical protein